MLVLGGCDAVFQLDLRMPVDAPPIDAPPPPIDVALANHDEDGDGVDDAIDNCPGRANTDQTDGDDDGVGQVCDPNPGQPIDRLRYFTGLSTLSGWTARSGSWEIVGETVRVTTSTGNQLIVLDLGPLEEPTVIATVEMIQGQAGTFGAGVYLVTDLAGFPGLPPGLLCYVVLPGRYMQMFDKRLATPTSRDGGLSGTMDPLEVTLAAGSVAAGTGPLCSGYRPDGSAVSVPTLDNPTPVATAHVGLYTYLATATFRSVTVIDRRP
jgi:hypothetical protein